MNIQNLKHTVAIRGLNENLTDETSLEFQSALQKQLTLQKELYNFFGTQPFDVIKDFFMYIPKGSIFFHGDNINEPEILFTKLKIPEKSSYFIEEGENLLEVYQYKINIQSIRLDGPVIKIMTTNEETGAKIENTIPQTSALLSKASNLRLVSNIKFSYEESIKKIADVKWVRGKKTHTLKDPSNLVSKDLLDLFLKIETQLDFIYNTSEEALYRKQKQKFVVFDQDWAATLSHDKYVYQHQETDKKYLTNKLLNDLEVELQTDITQFSSRNPTYLDELKSFYINCKEYYVLLSKPEDEFLKPPAKTQFFGNPCAETNIGLLKGASNPETAKTNAKYLYSMQVYMFQNDIFLLDYWKLSTIFIDYPDSFEETTALDRGVTGLDKRSMFWGQYFKGLTDDSKNKGIFTFPFSINPEINLNGTYTYNEKTYDKLTEYYTKFNNNTYKYRLRNYQPNEDSPIITHLNFILNLRGFSMNVQGYTDFDPAENYLIPTYAHPRVLNFFDDPDVIGISYRGGIVCREYTIFNSPTNLLFLCYSSTLPNYRTPTTEANYNVYFGAGRQMTKQNKERLIEVNNQLSDEDGDMFVDFSDTRLFNPTVTYTKFSVDIFANKMEFGSGQSYLKIIKKKYTNPTGLGNRKDHPQFHDLQVMLDECLVRKNIYNTIFQKLSNIKLMDSSGHYYLSMINNNLFEPNPFFANYTNHFKGFKLIFISDRLTLQNYCTYFDDQIRADTSISNNFRELSDQNISNLINNVSSGKITNYNNNPYSAFYSSHNSIIEESLQLQIIQQHNTYDYGRNHFNGALFELIRYNYNCPNNWPQLRDKMAPLELNVCSDIAKKISSSNENLIKTITSIDPNNCTDGLNERCLSRINKLVDLYNADSLLIEDDDDDDDL